MSDAIRTRLVMADAFLRRDDYQSLCRAFGSEEKILAQPVSGLTAAGLSAKKAEALSLPDEGQIAAGLDWLSKPSHRLVHFEDAAYPELLRRIPDPPLLLFIDGDPDVLHLPALAIVGSRNPTRGGRKNAYDFARHLGSAGFLIVSGLADGIDTAAHQGALEGGRTVAFLGNGIDRIYPASNAALARSIASSGALVSEYPLGTAPHRHHFPERNRLISGCCLGTIVIEAARRSGSLITARLAAEQGREVFALPGSIHNPLAKGCHKLLREGAKLVESAADIVSELPSLAACISQNSFNSMEYDATVSEEPDDYSYLRKLIGHDPITIDELATLSGLTIDQLSSMLLILELNGEIESLSGGRYSLLTEPRQESTS